MSFFKRDLEYYDPIELVLERQLALQVDQLQGQWKAEVLIEPEEEPEEDGSARNPSNISSK